MNLFDPINTFYISRYLTLWTEPSAVSQFTHIHTCNFKFACLFIIWPRGNGEEEENDIADGGIMAHARTHTLH